MINLSIFNNTNLFEAATNLFQQWYKISTPILPNLCQHKDILKDHYKDNDYLSIHRQNLFYRYNRRFSV